MPHKISLTTLIGFAYPVITAATVDWAKLSHGDHNEVAKLGGAFLVALLGRFAADQPKSAPGEVEKRETKGVPPGEDPLK